MTSHWPSVATSTDSRNALPSTVSAPSATRPRLRQPSLRRVELRGRPGPGADVGAQREPPIELGEQADLGGVESGRRPGGRVGVAAVLAQQVGQPPHVTHRVPGQAEAREAGEERLALRAQRSRPPSPAAGSRIRALPAGGRGFAPSWPTAPFVRAAQMVAASTLLQPNRTAGTTASGLKTAKAAATTSPGT